LAASGWEIGSHSCSHPRLTQVTDAALQAELRDSRAVLERQLGRCTSLAYPYGDVDSRVVEAAREAGYEAAVGLPLRLNGRDHLNWPRVGIYHTDRGWRYRAKVGRSLRRFRASAAWETLMLVRRRLRAGRSITS
jgi:peptidoglycan/xylan/chitin deacetylase (PgdA/CDA1 family)